MALVLSISKTLEPLEGYGMKALMEFEPNIATALPVLQVLEHFGLFADLENGEAKLRCPFHDDHNPSFGINMMTGLWYCFSCGVGGNLEGLVARLGKVEIHQAKLLILRLKKKAPTLPEGIHELNQIYEKKLIDYDVNEAWARFHKVNWLSVSTSVPAAGYLINTRGFTRHVLDAFDVRLTEDPDYPVVIPIRRIGELMGYVRRRITPGDKKYLFNWGFDLEGSLAYYRVDDEPCIITEGMLDYMLCAQYGVRHAATILTWKMKMPQAEWLMKEAGVREVICATDNTISGEAGFEEMKALMKGVKVRRFKFPGPYRKDVGELGMNEFHKAVMDTEESRQ